MEVLFSHSSAHAGCLRFIFSFFHRTLFIALQLITALSPYANSLQRANEHTASTPTPTTGSMIILMTPMITLIFVNPVHTLTVRQNDDDDNIDDRCDNII